MRGLRLLSLVAWMVFRSICQVLFITGLLFGLFNPAQSQWLETTIPLPDSIGGPGSPFSMAYNSREDKVYVGGISMSVGVLVIDATTDEKSTYICSGTSDHTYAYPAIAYDSLYNKVYFAVGDPYGLTIIDGTSDEVLAKLQGIEFASDLEGNPLDGKIYCSDRWADQVLIIDAAGDSLIKTLQVGAEPSDLLWNPSNNRVYCLNQGSDELTVIDGAGDTILTTIQVGVSPAALALNQASDKLYCTCSGSGQVIVLDTNTDTIITTITMGGSPGNLVCVPIENKIYCGNYSSGEVIVIDGSEDTVMATIPVDGIWTGALTYDAANRRIFCAVCDSFWDYVDVAIIDATSDTVITGFILGEGYGGSTRAGLLSSQGKVYATCLFSNSITVIDGASCQVENRIWTRFQVDSGWHQMICAGGKLYCRSYDSDAIAVLDPATNEVLSFIPTGVFPIDLAWNSTDDKLYCSNWYSDDLTVIDCGSDSVLTTILLRHPHSYTYPGPLVWNAKENKVYCGKTRRYELAVIDGASDSVISTINVGSYPVSLIWNPQEDKVYCANWLRETVTVIDGATDEILSTITVGLNPVCLLWSPLTNKLYCARDCDDDGVITVMDCATDSVLAHIWIANPPHRLSLVYNHTDNKIYSLSPRDGVVTVIDCTTDSVLVHIQMANPPHRLSLVYNHTDNKIYSLSPRDGVVTVIDGWADTILTTIEVGGWPKHAVWDSVNNWLLCGNDLTQNVAMIDGKGDTLMTTIPLGEKTGFLAWSAPQKRVYVSLSDFDREGKLFVIRSSLNDLQSPEMANIPTAFALLQNYPNPFNPMTIMEYALPEPGRVRLEVFNVLGQRVCTLVDDHQAAGFKRVQWDGRNDHGQQISSGVYFYQLAVGNHVEIKKMLIVR